MVTIHFYLKENISTSNQEILRKKDPEFYKELTNKMMQIYMTVSLPGERFRLYTGKRIKHAYWDSEKQEVNGKRMREGGDELNRWLHELKARTLKQCQLLENEGIRITFDEIRAVMFEKRIKKIHKADLAELIKYFMENHKTGGGDSLRSSTRKKYITFHHHLRDFLDSRKLTFRFDIINSTLLDDFRNYLVKKAGHTDNTVVKYVKAAKTFFRFYMNQGKIKAFNLASVKTMEKEGEIYVIPYKQVMQIQQMEIQNPTLSMVRDIFCFMCWTGQRYSDIHRIRWEQIYMDDDGKKVWELISTKTNDHIRVPIIEQANRILEKYAGYPTPIPIISSQKMNQSLKELGKLAVLNKSTKILRYFDGVKKEDFVPFYQVLTTHVARKSFITNALMLGVPERIVREVSGHKDEKSFRRYVKLVDSYKDEVIRGAFEGMASNIY